MGRWSYLRIYWSHWPTVFNNWLKISNHLTEFMFTIWTGFLKASLHSLKHNSVLYLNEFPKCFVRKPIRWYLWLVVGDSDKTKYTIYTPFFFFSIHRFNKNYSSDMFPIGLMWFTHMNARKNYTSIGSKHKKNFAKYENTSQLKYKAYILLFLLLCRYQISRDEKL